MITIISRHRVFSRDVDPRPWPSIADTLREEAKAVACGDSARAKLMRGVKARALEAEQAKERRP